MLLDAHTHLYFPDFQSDLDAIMERAQTAGVKLMINTGTNRETSWKAIEYANKYPHVYAAVGVHPNDSNKVDSTDWADFDEMMKEPKVVAIGEIGLDYYRDSSPSALQREVLINFLKIAERYKKPIVLHIRDAYPDTIKILSDFCNLPVRGMSHCFSGTVEQMQQLVQLGLHISFAGPITYPKNDELREAARTCPINRILTETDAPYLPPQPYRGKRNEPAYVAETVKKIAEIKQMPVEKLGEQLVKNACDLFKIKL